MGSHSDARVQAGYYTREPYETFVGSYYDVEEPVPGHYVKTEFDARRPPENGFEPGQGHRNPGLTFEETRPGLYGIHRSDRIELRNISGVCREAMLAPLFCLFYARI